MAEQMKFCRSCGKQIRADAKFCRYCGLHFEVSTQEAAQAISQRQNGGRVAAPESAGELLLGQFNESLQPVTRTAEGLHEQAQEILSPLRTLLGGARRFFTGIPGAVKEPKTLLPTLVLAFVWIVLPLLQRSGGNALMQLLSWFTFANGGAEREGFGLLGDIAGKGGVAVAIGSLFSGGLGSAFDGLRKLFSRKEKGGKLLMIPGVAVGIVLYLFCAGRGMNAGTTMAGISGALLFLQSVGSGSGFLHSLAESLTSEKRNGVRIAHPGRINSLLGGSALGFAVVTAASVLF